MKKIVYFEADWCSFCKRLRPHVEKITSDKNINIEYLDVDVPENMAKLKEFGLQTIPTLVVYDEDGKAGEPLVNPTPIQVSKALE